MDAGRAVEILDSPYEGQPLGVDEIRLLNIESDGDGFSLQTTTHNLNGIIAFDAVSYVWGPAASSVIVSCNRKDLLITPTLFEMLAHLHKQIENHGRGLWIDAICIDQHNPDEKAVQVPRMHRIFSGATFVLIWTGPLIPQTEVFMYLFPDVSSAVKEWSLLTREDVHPWSVDRRVPPLGHTFWAGFFHILNNDWFRRLWTFQESVLAQRAILLSGTMWCDLDLFIEFVVQVRYKGPYLVIPTDGPTLDVPGEPRIISLAWQSCHMLNHYRADPALKEVSAGSTPSLLEGLRSRKAQEAVDRIWAVTGLFRPDLQARLMHLVDYSETGRSEYWNTHFRVAKILIAEAQCLIILCLPPVIEAKNPSLPSWCPSFFQRPACRLVINDLWNHPILHPGQHLGDMLHCDGDDKVESRKRLESVYRHPKLFIDCTTDDRHLRTRGFIADTIAEVVEETRLQDLGGPEQSGWLSGDLPDDTALSYVVEWHVRGLDLARRLKYGGDADTDDIPPEYLMAFFNDCRVSEAAETAYRDALPIYASKDHSCLVDLNPLRLRRALDCVSQFKLLAGLSFFSTEGGRFGVAHPGCKTGDRVCVFYGAHPLHIMRWPVSESSSESATRGVATFCGVAYIPHLMEQDESDAARLGPDEIFVIG